MYKKFFISILIIGFWFIGATHSFAQSVFSENPITMNYAENMPEPNTKISIKLNSGEVALNSASIAWYVNGKLYKKETGLTSIETTLGELGSSTTISIDVKDVFGNTFSESTTITPGIIDMIWESNSFTPPFYKGKALPPRRSPITVFAFPTIYNSDGSLLNPDRLTYEWSTREGVNINESGFNKNSFPFQIGSIAIISPITLKLYSEQGQLVGSKTIFVDYYNPELLLYMKDPLGGIFFNNAIKGTYQMTKSEVSLEAFPLFFDISKNTLGEVTYEWKLNGYTIDNSVTSRITFRSDENKGTARLDVLVKNDSRFFETLKDSLLFKLNTQ